MFGFLDGDDRSKSSEREVNAREPKSTSLSHCAEEQSDSRTYGTRLVWNSFKSTFKLPSNRSEAVTLDTTWAMILFRLVYPGAVIPSRFLQMS